MAMIQSDMQGAIDSLVREQRNQPGDLDIDVFEFDYIDPDVPYEPTISVTAEEYPGYKLIPRGGTALHDAMALSIDYVGKRLNELSEDDKPASVQFVIVTDGYENSSRQFTAKDVAARISRQRDKYNWDFLFVGANQDAVLTARDFGIPASSSLTYTASSAGVENSLRSVSAYVTGTRSGLGYEFTDEDRAKANS